HGLVEESSIVGRILGPLAAGSPQGLGDLNKGRNMKMSIEITGRSSGHDDDTNVRVSRESFQRFGQRIAHLGVEIDSFGAAQCNERNSIGYLCRQNIGVHLAPP